jgi:hypothetical protein
VSSVAASQRTPIEVCAIVVQPMFCGTDGARVSATGAQAAVPVVSPARGDVLPAAS